MGKISILASNGLYDVFLLLGIMIILGLFIGRLAERHRIPNITGYLFVGILFGLVLTLFYEVDLLNTFLFITKFCLGFIALSIGLELNFKHIWARRREVLVLTLVQAVSAFFFTSVGLFIFGMDLHIALF